MRFRLWARVCRARRRIKRLEYELKAQEAAFKKIRGSLTKHYETRLAYERTKSETIHQEWANKFLQLQKLSQMTVTTSLIEEKAAHQLLPEHKEEQEMDLSPNQWLELQDRKDQFFKDGTELGHSLTEIHQKWRELEPDIAGDVKLSIQ